MPVQTIVLSNCRKVGKSDFRLSDFLTKSEMANKSDSFFSFLSECQVSDFPTLDSTQHNRSDFSDIPTFRPHDSNRPNTDYYEKTPRRLDAFFWRPGVEAFFVEYYGSKNKIPRSIYTARTISLFYLTHF